jgi:TRAP-type C4-dicarboxylate transport system permease small subunit
VWIDPLLRHLVLWIGFLGALLATRTVRHINVDALSRLLPAPVLRVTRPLTNLFAACVCLLLTNACFKMVREEASFGTAGFLDVPVWVLQAVMPLALWLMAYRFASHAVSGLRGGADAGHRGEVTR